MQGDPDEECGSADEGHAVAGPAGQVQVRDRAALLPQRLRQRRQWADLVVAGVDDGLRHGDRGGQPGTPAPVASKAVPREDQDGGADDPERGGVDRLDGTRGHHSVLDRDDRRERPGQGITPGRVPSRARHGRPPYFDADSGRRGRSVTGRADEQRGGTTGVIATFRTPSRRSPKSSYASSISSSAKRCVSSGGGSKRPAAPSHQPAHALLAARAQRRDDAVVAEAGGERVVRHLQLARVDAEARERAARSQASAARSRRSPACRAPRSRRRRRPGQALDLGDDVDLR